MLEITEYNEETFGKINPESFVANIHKHSVHRLMPGVFFVRKQTTAATLDAIATAADSNAGETEAELFLALVEFLGSGDSK